MLDLTACWSHICDVDTAPLLAWLEKQGPGIFPTLPGTHADKPQRVRQLPMELLQPIFDAVLRHFPAGCVAYEPMLSRMRPGQEHGMHVDHTPAYWVTRVHVPLVTNTSAWVQFEEQEDESIRNESAGLVWRDAEGVFNLFLAGKAYSFDMRRRHAFGNDGQTDRVHLIFEVMTADCGDGAIRRTA